MNRRLKYILLTIYVISIATYMLSPDWIKEGTLENFFSWYPSIGFVVYIGFHFVFPFLIFTFFSLLFLLFFWALWLSGKKILVAMKNKKNMYVLILIGLIMQFFICIKYQEFYPAVIMPRFSNGENFDHPIKNVRGEVHIKYDQNKVAKLDLKEFLNSFHGNHARKNFIAKRMLKKIQQVKNVDWILNVISKNIHSKDINEIKFYKIEELYEYKGMNGLIKTEVEKKNIFTIKMK